jgi:hypothetical protein
MIVPRKPSSGGDSSGDRIEAVVSQEHVNKMLDWGYFDALSISEREDIDEAREARYGLEL